MEPSSSPNATSPLTAFLNAEEALLKSAMEDYHITRMMWALSLALLLYDWLLTFADEVRYIWQGRFLWTNLLFYWNRYWPMFNLIFDNIVLATVHNSDAKFCSNWMNFLSYGSIPYEISICTVYIMRLYALYGCNRKILVFLCIFYVGVISSESTIIGIIAHDSVFEPLPGPLQEITGCIPSGIKPWAWTFWLPMLTFETLLLVLSLFRSMQLIFEDRRPAIIYVLLRDSVIYFGGVVLAIVTNVVGWKVAGNGLFAAFFPVAIMAFSVLASRLLLNMHDAVDPSNRFLQATAYGTRSTTTNGDLPTHGTASIQFGRNSAVDPEGMSEADVELSNL